MANSPDLSNEAVIDLFINALRAQKRSSNTVRNYGVRLRVLAERLYPTTLLAATYEDLLSWQTAVSTCSVGTVAGYVSSIRTFYRWCVRPMHLIPHSPAEDLVPPPVPPYRPRPMPERDFQQALLAAAVDERMLTWLTIIRYAGLRCCEVAWMQRDWVIDDVEPRILVTGKGRRRRTVFVDGELIDVLRPFMRRQGTLFTHDNGRPLSPRYVSNHINGHFAGLGLNYTAHQVRHLFGTDALHRTKNLRLVQEMMGHASPATTQVYTEVDHDEAVAFARELGADLRRRRRS